MRRALKITLIVATLAVFAACEREERGFRVQPPNAERVNSKQLTTLQAGESAPAPNVINEYEENAFALSEGKRLFSQMNCVGCHAHGGGGMGPA
jgi:cytochrome c oxidase cbb3-type subunit 3